MALRRSFTATVERNVEWMGEFASEPYEAAWASEAIFFVRALDASDSVDARDARVQISADGIRWVDEGTVLKLPVQADEVTFCRVSHFGGWLRIAGMLEPNCRIKVLVSLALKE